MEGSKIKVSELYQVGIVVHNLEKRIEQYKLILGIEPWGIVNVDPSTAKEMTYYGKPVKHRFKAAFAMVGQMQLELIQPIEGENIYSDFLRQHGEGIHHLGHIRVTHLAESIKALEEHGLPCIQSGRLEGVGYAYIDTSKILGVIIELLEIPIGIPVPFRY